MSSRLLAVAYEASDPQRLARFWAELLGRGVTDDPAGPLLAGTETQVGLRFVPGRPHTDPNRMHLHLTSDGDADQPQLVAAALRLGASHLDVGQRPEEGHVVLADPEGNELCVIEPGNGFLAGCGLLGELGCEGSREVGVFWSAALDWPLVWDRDGETAVQSPAGGTKLAWGGPPVTPLNPAAPPRQRLELVVDDRAGLHVEVDRLLALGATRVGEETDAVVLADPDGNPFRVLA